ncbi:MAG: HAMP domain-containing sensor histidine kinase [Phycisphaeraceae bacterium]
MTLARRLAVHITALIVGLVLLAGASLWGIRGLSTRQAQWEARDSELRQLYTLGLDVAAAKEAITGPVRNPGVMTTRVGGAATKLQRYQVDLSRAGGSEDWLAQQRASVEAAMSKLRIVLVADPRGITSDEAQTDAAFAALNLAQNHIAAMSQRTNRAIDDIERARQHQVNTTMWVIGLLAGALVLGAVVAGVLQHRVVMRPLTSLRGGVARLARGQFDQRLPGAGDTEFAELAQDFNRMAEELDGLYRDLEGKVAAKSRELAQSERLASVGFLAAGVAHEINNPLGIISGHAELSVRALEKGEGDAAAQTLASLRVIAEEAFRCKEITERLLALSRRGPAEGDLRNSVSLAALAREVVALVSGVGRYKTSRVTVDADDEAPLQVRANANEVRQVLLNLTINALEAIGGQADGHVEICLRRRDGVVELAVIDNGVGMSAATLGRVFEPFYSERRQRGHEPADAGRATSGTGLGLSIAHAIVKDHGGSLTAQSDGPGRGSRFTMVLPAAT